MPSPPPSLLSRGRFEDAATLSEGGECTMLPSSPPSLLPRGILGFAARLGGDDTRSTASLDSALRLGRRPSGLEVMDFFLAMRTGNCSLSGRLPLREEEALPRRLGPLSASPGEQDGQPA
jgi:hypothetical protein